MAKSRYHKFRKFLRVGPESFHSLDEKYILWETKLSGGYRVSLFKLEGAVKNGSYEIYIRNMNRPHRSCSICLIDEDGAVTLKYRSIDEIYGILSSKELKDLLIINKIHSS